MSTYPAGNVVECMFAFTSRQLTPAEAITFLAGGGLPTSVGEAQTTVKMDYSINDGSVVTLSGASIINDSVGAYHGLVTVTKSGTYRYRGYSLDGNGSPVASTSTQFFTVTAF